MSRVRRKDLRIRGIVAEKVDQTQALMSIKVRRSSLGTNALFQSKIVFGLVDCIEVCY